MTLFNVKYKYSINSNYLNYEISVIDNNLFYIFCEHEKFFCYEEDGKRVDTASITLSDDVCKHSRGRLIYFNDKILVQTNNSNLLTIFELKNIMN